MTNEVEITFEGDHIKVLSNGEKTYESASRLLEAVRIACEEHECFLVLGVADTEVPLTMIEAYDQAKLFDEVGITPKYRIAWVELNPKAIDTIDFIETVLSNRGLPGRLFADVSRAKKWLLGGGS